MVTPSTQKVSARGLMELARHNRVAAEKAIAALDLQGQLTLICEAPIAKRASLLSLLPHPDLVVCQLPEAELCHTVKAVGLHDASWIIEYATPEQLVACIDLDAWNASIPDRDALGSWMLALSEAGGETLSRTVRALDPEIVGLWLRSRIAVVLHEGDDDFTPPIGGRTLDDQFYFIARDPKDDMSEIDVLLRALFQNDYWFYFQLMQSVEDDLESECEEWALRWRNGRLQDLGFPPYEESLAIYAPLTLKDRKRLTETDKPIEVEEWPLPIWMPNLPESRDDAPSLLKVIASMPEKSQKASLYGIIALANRVVIADNLNLGDAETIPLAINKVIHLASRGLDYLAVQNDLLQQTVTSRTSLQRLFRVGANIERDESKTSS